MCVKLVVLNGGPNALMRFFNLCGKSDLGKIEENEGIVIDSLNIRLKECELLKASILLTLAHERE